MSTVEDLTRALSTLEGEPADVAQSLVDEGWCSPDDVNALRNQAIAYNSLMWRLAVAIGWAQETEDASGVIDVDLAELVESALQGISAGINDGWNPGPAPTTEETA